MTKVAKSFGVSDVAVAKACRRAEIPVPPRGYWARKRAGQAVEQERLPEIDEPDWRFHFTPGQEDASNEEPLQFPDLGPPPRFPNDRKARRIAITARVGSLVVSPLGAACHALVAPLRQSHDAKGEPLEHRRLTLLSSLLSALEQAGAALRSLDKVGEEFEASLDGNAIYFTVARQRPYVAGLSLEQASRMLAIRQTAKRGDGVAQCTWNERKLPLEEQITDVVVSLLLAVEDNRRSRLTSGYRNKVREREWEIERERQRQEHRQQLKLQQLEENSSKFERAQSIRTLVAAVSKTYLDVEARNWCKWATEEADRIDPVVGRRFLAPLEDELDSWSLGRW